MHIHTPASGSDVMCDGDGRGRHPSGREDCGDPIWLSAPGVTYVEIVCEYKYALIARLACSLLYLQEYLCEGASVGIEMRAQFRHPVLDKLLL